VEVGGKGGGRGGQVGEVEVVQAVDVRGVEGKQRVEGVGERQGREEVEGEGRVGGRVAGEEEGAAQVVEALDIAEVWSIHLRSYRVSDTYCESFEEIFERDIELSLDFEMREI
jgi:hypothetical protein